MVGFSSVALYKVTSMSKGLHSKKWSSMLVCVCVSVCLCVFLCIRCLLLGVKKVELSAPAPKAQTPACVN